MKKTNSSPTESSKRRLGKRAKSVLTPNGPFPSFVRLKLADSNRAMFQIKCILEMMCAQEAHTWHANKFLFLDFVDRQDEPCKPVHADPAVRDFLGSIQRNFEAHVSFVGYPRGLSNLTDESLAVVTLRPPKEIFQSVEEASTFRTLCNRALRDQYPNTELLFGAAATELLGILPFANEVSERLAVSERLDGLNSRLNSVGDFGELRSSATVYGGTVGYFAVRALEIAGEVQRVIVFCAEDEYARIVTRFQLKKSAQSK